jgi:hypothetical protein
MEIDFIGLGTDDNSVGIYLVQKTYDENGDYVHFGHDIKMPLALIQRIADLLPLLIEKSNSETDKESWETYHLYSPKELERADSL